jgi:hypothetical protein
VLQHPSLRIARPSVQPLSADRAAGSSPSQASPRDIFKGMVVASLDAGFLRYSRRQELLELAARMGIGEFEACLLIAEAQFRSSEIDPVELAETGLEPNPVPAGVSISMQIGLALVAAPFVDLVVVCWLL